MIPCLPSLALAMLQFLPSYPSNNLSSPVRTRPSLANKSNLRIFSTILGPIQNIDVATEITPANAVGFLCLDFGPASRTVRALECQLDLLARYLTCSP